MKTEHMIPGKRVLDVTVTAALLFVLTLTAGVGLRCYPFYRIAFSDHAAAQAAALHFTPLVLLFLCRLMLGGRIMTPLTCQLAAQGMCAMLYLLRGTLPGAWLRYAVPPLLLLFLPAVIFSLLEGVFTVPHKGKRVIGRSAAAVLFAIVAVLLILAAADPLLFGVILRLSLPICFLPLGGVVMSDLPWPLKLSATLTALIGIFAVTPGAHQGAMGGLLCLFSVTFW